MYTTTNINLVDEIEKLKTLLRRTNIFVWTCFSFLSFPGFVKLDACMLVFLSSEILKNANS